MITCKNCHQQFKGNFCNYCGQSALTHEINFQSILHEIQYSIIHVGNRLLLTKEKLFQGQFVIILRAEISIFILGILLLLLISLFIGFSFIINK